MRKRNLSLPITIRPEFCIVIALSLLIFPMKWVIAWIGASFFHELCHYVALRFSGCRVFRIQVNLNGAMMEADLLTRGREIFCALAGPFGGFSLLLIAKWFPRLAICGCFQALYNMIPLFPLDGGRVLHCILGAFLSDQWRTQIEKHLENCILFIFLILGGYASFCMDMGIIPILFAIILIIKNKKIKFTCNERPLGVE